MQPLERELLDITESFIDRAATMDRQGLHIEHRFILYCELPDHTVIRAGMDATPEFMVSVHPVGLRSLVEECRICIEQQGVPLGLTPTNGTWWAKYERVIYEDINPWQSYRRRPGRA